MVGTRRGLLRVVGTVAASATLGWSYLSESNDDIVGTTSAGEEGGKTTEDGGGLVDRLRSGGLLLYVPPPEPSGPRGRSLESAYRQCVSPLSHSARQSARQLGDALRALDVPVGSVLSSESCACLDTARLAFGHATRSRALTDPSTGPIGSDGREFEDALSTPPPYGSNLILVGRRAPLEAVADVALDAGEVAVLAPWGDGVETVGRIRTNTLRRQASSTGPPPLSVTSYPIRVGTPEETAVYRSRTGTGGPTVFVLGGVHGNEEAGYRTASRATEWHVDDGTLVVLPRANRPAIESTARTGRGGRDLNRQFPLGERPTSPLSRAIWATVRRHDPDLLVDMHASGGLLARDEGYVGQAVFHSGHPTLVDRVRSVVAYLNRSVVPGRRSEYDYLVGRMDGNPEGMVATKAARDLDVPSCIYEVTEDGLAVETQVGWTTSFLRRVLSVYGLQE